MKRKYNGLSFNYEYGQIKVFIKSTNIVILNRDLTKNELSNEKFDEKDYFVIPHLHFLDDLVDSDEKFLLSRLISYYPKEKYSKTIDKIGGDIHYHVLDIFSGLNLSECFLRIRNMSYNTQFDKIIKVNIFLEVCSFLKSTNK